MALVVKNLSASAGRLKRHELDPWVRRIPLEEGTATHSSVLAWRIPWTEEPGGLQYPGVAKSRKGQSKQLTLSLWRRGD